MGDDEQRLTYTDERWYDFQGRRMLVDTVTDKEAQDILIVHESVNDCKCAQHVFQSIGRCWISYCAGSGAVPVQGDEYVDPGGIED